MRWAAMCMPLLVTACTVDRIVPLDQFACQSADCDAGTIARDGGPQTPPRDAGFKDPRDGGEVGMDVPIVDTGVIPLPMCPGIQPMPDTGVALGSIDGETNGFEGGCAPNGGKDVVWGFTVPGRLWTLEITTAGTDFDTVLHVYRDECVAPSQIACGDETENELIYAPTASIVLKDVEPGSYAAILDSFALDSMGDYVLRVKGEIAPGEICDPSQAYMTCLIGDCTVQQDGVPRCPAVLDCNDGVDADRDGMTDEDGATCTNPPVVTCSPPPTVVLDRPAMPSASVTDDGTIVYREWTTETLPSGSYSLPQPPDQEGTSLLLDIDGLYRMRYFASDDDFQLSACELDITPTSMTGLRAELVWSVDKPRFASTEFMFMTMLHPSATSWFDPMFSCSGPPCFDMPPDWGRQMDFSDDPLWVGFFYGPQRTYVDVPTTSGRYAFGVHLIDLGGNADVTTTVNIFCAGMLVASYTTSLDTGAFETQDLNDFWKVAEVSVNANGSCDVFPFGDGTNDIVRAIDAMGNR